MDQNETEAKVGEHCTSRLEDLRKLYYGEKGETPEEACKRERELWEYGLGIDIVEAGTFKWQRATYIRYQISWGGPSEEFRIYQNGDVEFCLMDWFTSATCDVAGTDAEMIKDICQSEIQHIGWKMSIWDGE